MDDNQLFLPGFEPGFQLDVLFFALLPRAADASRIASVRDELQYHHGLTGRSIGPRRLHVSLQGVGAYDGVSPATVRKAKDAVAVVSASALDVVFDHAMTFDTKRDRRPLVLLPDSGGALADLYQRLGDAMRAVGFRRIGRRFTPHMTLLYDEQIVPMVPIEPVQWTADHIALVLSLRGRGRSDYVRLGEWPLRK